MIDHIDCNKLSLKGECCLRAAIVFCHVKANTIFQCDENVPIIISNAKTSMKTHFYGTHPQRESGCIVSDDCFFKER